MRYKLNHAYFYYIDYSRLLAISFVWVGDIWNVCDVEDITSDIRLLSGRYHIWYQTKSDKEWYLTTGSDHIF